ncbi:helix-turn-helix domain-containing protein [Lysobacter arenosi]|uniref:Helix-turn-helix domain-containing protein n=1 Tax=Lysobacter arenosi TaxID=2795387 RepID=A0ABX7R829_9GAMM|nr:helix-turn-helix transcriptional regulator [Lysobacter arenosi]QSX74229.1 helix-turn-helix domain-containing protein [Lysobacter arenosi]
MDLAGFIERARDKKDLSFRKLERASDLDHAYIWHLAKGSKTSPSETTLEKLSEALSLDERERAILQLLAEQPIDDALFNLMITRRDIAWDELRDVSRVSNRGDRQTTEEGWLKLIEHMRELF